MAESHVVSGLVAKHSELAGLLDHHRREMVRIAGDLSHLDATIKLFAPELNLRGVRAKEHRKRNSYFKPGDAPRVLLDILRVAGCPMTSREMGERALAERGMEVTAERIDSIQKSILVTIKRLEGKKLIRVALVGKGGTRSWKIA